MKCTRDECGYEWQYKGQSTKPTCPRCTYKISLKKMIKQINEQPNLHDNNEQTTEQQ